MNKQNREFISCRTHKTSTSQTIPFSNHIKQMFACGDFSPKSIKLFPISILIWSRQAPNDNHISQSHQSCIGPLIVAVKGVRGPSVAYGLALALSLLCLSPSKQQKQLSFWLLSIVERVCSQSTPDHISGRPYFRPITRAYLLSPH